MANDNAILRFKDLKYYDQKMDEVIDSLKPVFLTQAEYDALGDEKYTNGVQYIITDTKEIINPNAESGVGLSTEGTVYTYTNPITKEEVEITATAADEIFNKYESNIAASPNGWGAHAEGANTKAIGDGSHAEGLSSEAIGNGTHAEGQSTKAIANGSHAEGAATTASGNYSHAEGMLSVAKNSCAHAEGNSCAAEGENSHAEGNNTKAIGVNSHAEGVSTTADADNAHAEGRITRATGIDSHAEGYDTESSGEASHAEGYSTVSSGKYSHAEGADTAASAHGSHVEGIMSEANGDASHAEGYDTTAIGNNSHAEGHQTKAVAENSHAEGYQTEAMQSCAHVEGMTSKANGLASHAEGEFIQANGKANHAQGRFNIANTNVTTDNPYGDYAHIVGNGTDEDNRSNAHTLDWEGNAWFAGTIKGKNFDSESISNPNLLINPDFKINQRGQTEVTAAGYTADHWYLRAASGYKVTVEDGGLRIANTVGETTTGSVVWQVIPLSEMDLRGCTLTVSAKISEVVGTTGLRFITDGTAPAGLQITKDGIYTVTYTIGEYTNNVGVGLVSASTDCSALFEWAKMEIGPVATPFTPPDPATELVKCQRYYASHFVVKNGFYGTAYADREKCARLTVALPATIRNLPTIVYTADNLALFDGVNIISITALEVHTMMGNKITLSVIAEGLTIGKSYLLLATDNTTIAYSAEL